MVGSGRARSRAPYDHWLPPVSHSSTTLPLPFLVRPPRALTQALASVDRDRAVNWEGAQKLAGLETTLATLLGEPEPSADFLAERAWHPPPQPTDLLPMNRMKPFEMVSSVYGKISIRAGRWSRRAQSLNKWRLLAAALEESILDAPESPNPRDSRRSSLASCMATVVGSGAALANVVGSGSALLGSPAPQQPLSAGRSPGSSVHGSSSPSPDAQESDSQSTTSPSPTPPRGRPSEVGPTGFTQVVGRFKQRLYKEARHRMLYRLKMHMKEV